MTMTAREYLVGLDLARPSKGRFSAEAKEALAKALSEGMTFSDWDENGRIVKTITSTVNKRINHNPDNVVELKVVKETKPEPEDIPEEVKIVSAPIQRKENAIKVIDDLGFKIVVGHCSMGHAIVRCQCVAPKPGAWLRAQSFELIEV